MTKLLVHTGRHKSATTTIQSWLFENWSENLAAGYLYPKTLLGKDGTHSDFAKSLDTKIHGLDMSAADPFCDQLKTEMKACDPGVVVISSEYFQEFESLELVQAMKELLGFDEVESVCYIREQVDYAVTSFKQCAQAGQPIPLQTICNYYSGDYLEFFLGLWDSFGTLKCRPFHQSLLRDGDIVADFCHCIGLQARSTAVAARNPSIGGSLLAFTLSASASSLHLDYSLLESVAQMDEEFTRSFRIPDSQVEVVRGNSTWNSVLRDMFPGFPLSSWEECRELVLDCRVESDFALFIRIFELSAGDAKAIFSNLDRASRYVTLTG